MVSINQDHDNSGTPRMPNQNQEDVEMDGQDEQEVCQNNANGPRENQMFNSKRKEQRVALQEVPQAQHSDGQNRMISGLNKHSQADEVGKSGLESQPDRGQDSHRAKQARQLKESNQGSASNGSSKKSPSKTSLGVPCSWRICGGASRRK